MPVYLKTRYAWDRLFADSKTVLTIHNLGFQGVFGGGILYEMGLSRITSYNVCYTKLLRSSSPRGEHQVGHIRACQEEESRSSHEHDPGGRTL